MSRISGSGGGFRAPPNYTFSIMTWAGSLLRFAAGFPESRFGGLAGTECSDTSRANADFPESRIHLGTPCFTWPDLLALV